MNVTASRQAVADVAAEVLVVGIFDGDDGLPAAVAGSPVGVTVAALVASKDLSAKVGEFHPLLGLGSGSGLKAGAVATLGLGPRDKFDAGAAFSAGVAAGKKLAARERGEVACLLPSVGKDDAATVAAVVAGLIVGTRGADLRKAEPARHPFGGLAMVGSESEVSDAAVARGAILGEAINLARDLANTPPAEKTPTVLAARARAEAEKAGLSVTVWDEPKIREERFGGLLGVAAGSDEPPAFVVLEHRGGGADAPTLAIVGKGVTFDSGGLSLKPSASMEDMKADMTGAAVTLATLIAAARLRLPVNLVGYLALTENMVNGKAMRLGDVLTMRNGKTVEVMNTDAEGRLILADALSYASEQKPARIVDLATLTGACMVALGTKVAGLFSNDDSAASDVLAASTRTGERAWRLPLDADYLEQLKSPVADLKNVGTRWGGSITAAKFLEQFVAEVPWVHLDIAGPSWAESDSSTRDAGGTGCFVRTLVDWIENQPIVLGVTQSC